MILEPIPKEPNEVPSYVPSSLYFPDVFKTLKAASRIVFPSSLNELGIKPWPKSRTVTTSLSISTSISLPCPSLNSSTAFDTISTTSWVEYVVSPA